VDDPDRLNVLPDDPVNNSPSSTNGATQPPAHAGQALKQNSHSVAWLVCCSGSFGLKS
jgi:hypothetical protein